MKLFQKPSSGLAEEVSFFFLFITLLVMLFNGAERFEKFFWKVIIKNIPVILFQNPSTGLAVDVVLSFLF